MQHGNNSQLKNADLWLSMLIGAIFPMLLGAVLANYFSDWRWSHYPFHSMVESVGAITAFTISTLMVLMLNRQRLPRYYIWPACALIGMGILDGAHAVLYAGGAFVWLHSVATMVGGLIFSGIWLPEAWLTAQRQRALIHSVISFSLLVSVLSVLSPDTLPQMIVNGEFSLLAKVFNIAGGVGFLMGSVFFVRHKILSGRYSENNEHISKDKVFANHCLLFGIAGLLFESSVIWDAGWWWWHILRLAAYLVVLVYFFVLFKEQQDDLSASQLKLSRYNQQLEQRVQERTLEFEKASRAKSDFLSQMSHELRTPMNAVLGFAQMLKLDEDKFDATQKDNVNEILGAGRHLLSLIEEVLDLSKIESGNMDVYLEDVELDEVLRECLVLIRSQDNSIGLDFVDEVSDKGFVLKADPTKLKQVFLNLLSNAVKYNSIHGSVILNAKLINGQQLRIYISDTGKGLTEEEISRLFNAFERLDSKDDVEGTGIGLYITKQLLELMGGKVGVESVKGEGSTFWVELMLA